MNKKMFQKLNQSVNTLDLLSHVYCGTRIANCLSKANIASVIEIYKIQEIRGGYGYSKGLRRLRNFAAKSLVELQAILQNKGFPKLQDGATIVQQYEKFAKNH